MTKNDKAPIDVKLDKIRDLVRSRDRDDYGALCKRLTKAREVFHEVLADRMTEPFNAHLAAAPQHTLEEKQLLIRNANADLRSFGLAIKCPRTGQPAILQTDAGHNPSEGRFQIALISSESGRKRTLTSRSLFRVELMAHPLRREPLAEYWAARLKADTPPSRG